jgi:hypothetical protein
MGVREYEMGGVLGSSATVRRGPARRASQLALAVGASLLALSVWALPTAAAEGESSITVERTERDDPPAGCAPLRNSLRYETEDGDDAFVLRILTDVPLCQPVVAAAVIYEMPGNGRAWPQQLRERREFELQPAGVTEVRFDKTCMPAQFDVVVGASPSTIEPFGQWHGPLLFPGDTATARQHWGSADCGPGGTTTTLPPESTTTTTLPITPTVPQGPGPEVSPETGGPAPGGGAAPTEVLGATTVPAPAATAGDPPAATGPSVLGASQTPSVAGLALTGTSVLLLVILGSLLILSGVAIVVFPRPRRQWGR